MLGVKPYTHYTHYIHLTQRDYEIKNCIYKLIIHNIYFKYSNQACLRAHTHTEKHE